MLNNGSFTLCTACGKVMHKKCNDQLRDAKGLSLETRSSCPMCRALCVVNGSKEHIKRLQNGQRINGPVPWEQGLVWCGCGFGWTEKVLMNE